MVCTYAVSGLHHGTDTARECRARVVQGGVVVFEDSSFSMSGAIRRHNEKDSEGHLQGGFEAFYRTNHDVDAGKPQLRTYNGRQAEKFFETNALPLAPARPGKAAAPVGPPSLTWGIGGTLPVGRYHGKPLPAADFKYSCKMYIPQTRSDERPFVDDTGLKKHVYNKEGKDYHDLRSKDHYLEDIIGKKKMVPEEERCDKRVIHRMAPPGLKGYMGSEYSNEFYLRGTYRPNDFMLRATEDCDLDGDAPTAIERPPRKTFKQKRAEEDFLGQVDLVTNYLDQPAFKIPLASGEGEVIDSDDEMEQTLGEMDKALAD